MHSLTAILIYLISFELFKSDKISFYSAVSYLTLPLVSFFSMAITTDAFLLFFWSLTLYFFIKSIKYNKTLYWILAGVSAGLGLLSKYNMLLFIVSAVLYLMTSEKNKNVLKNKKFYLSVVIAAIVYFPNFMWQIKHHFVSFMHTEDISEIDKKYLHFKHLIDFILSQFGVFGPIFFSVLIYLVVRPFIKDDRFKLLYAFTYVMLGVISLVALLGRAFANWASPTYVTGTILVVAFLIIKQRETLLKTAIGINILLAVVFYHYHDIAKILNIKLNAKNDPYKRVLGWQQLADKIKPFIKHCPNCILLYDNRKIMSEMVYYLRDFKNKYAMFNPTHEYRDQFDLDTNINQFKNKRFLYITDEKNINKIKRYFCHEKEIGTVEVKVYNNLIRRLNLYLLEKCKK
jgi:4-amino-4-deoxy-L-arabinose transferase-like glycosyltransferase